MAGILSGYRPIGTSTFTTTFHALARIRRRPRRGLPVPRFTTSVTTGTSMKVTDSTTIRTSVRTRW